jgi:hypothetical protein
MEINLKSEENSIIEEKNQEEIAKVAVDEKVIDEKVEDKTKIDEKTTDVIPEEVKK